ncbi:MAG: ATP synthase F0 subunit A [Chloroflexi bacterium UTCFX4]|nr:MAG: ATP synthase F0 subunit A [Chloroflexi bacterium UTCFX4]
MLKNPKLWIAIIALFAVGVVIKLFFPFTTQAVRASVAVAPEVIFELGSFPVTPTILTMVLVFILLVAFAFFSTRKMELVPSGMQNVMETIIEQLIGLFESIAGPMWAKFFSITATIFLLVLLSNYLGLIPGAGSIGFIKVGAETHTDVQNGQVCFQNETTHACDPSGIFVLADAPSFVETYDLYTKAQIAKGIAEEPHAAFVPILRAPSSDINMPLALALISVFMTQVYGMQKQGLKYWTRFFSFGRLLKGDIAFGLIDVFVGIVELISEIFKIVSFTFRLFGNIFAGEVILLIMAFLFAILPLPFYGLEFFVAFIQAFVFAVLTAAFMRIATAEHGGGGHEGEAHH